jgi:hypothetical protein
MTKILIEIQGDRINANISGDNLELANMLVNVMEAEPEFREIMVEALRLFTDTHKKRTSKHVK